MTNLIFISGATGGLGKAFAVECASRGWDLFLTDLEEDRLQALAGALSRTYGVDVYHYTCDMTEPDARRKLFSFIQKSKLVFHMIINVAGVDFEGLFLERTDSEIRTIVRLNIESTLDVTHHLLRFAAPDLTFRIINVSSLAAFYPMPVKATYAASKRFLLDFSLALRDELRSSGSTVTVLCPAGMPTTPSTIAAIHAQGLFGQLTTMDIGVVAAKTLDHALRGCPVYVPGRLNQMIRFAGSLFPPASLARFIGNRWRAAKDRRSTPEFKLMRVRQA